MFHFWLLKKKILIKISHVCNTDYVLTCWHNVGAGDKAGLTPDCK